MSEKDKICRELGYPSGYAQALSMLENSDDLKCDLDDIIALISSLQSENERLKKENLRLVNEKEDNWQLYVDANLQTVRKEARIRKYIEEIERLKSSVSNEGVREIIQRDFEYYKGLAQQYQNTPSEQKWNYKMMAIRDLIKKLPSFKPAEEKKEDICTCKNTITENMHTCYNCGKLI